MTRQLTMPMVGRSKSIRLLAVILPLSLALAACGGKGAEAKGDKAAEAATPVQVVTAVDGDISHVVQADAVLYPQNQGNLMSKVSAPVRRVLVNRGDHVKAGQVVALLENADLTASVAENKALVEQAQSAYRTTTAATLPEDATKAQTDVQTAQQTVDAAKKLYDNREQLLKEGAIAHKLVDDAKVALVQAQSHFQTAQRHLESLQSVGRQEQVKNAQGQLDAAKARYQNAEAQLSYTEMRSPISGVVADRPVYPGEIATAGSPIISVVDISQVTARANVPVTESGSIRVGQAATIAAPDGQITGKVTVISPAVDPSTTTVEVWIQASNPGERIKPGITAHVSIDTGTIKSAVLVPPSALLSSDEGGVKVMVVGADSVAHERPVEVGVRNAEKVQITKGLKPGEQVVVSGGLGLEDKAKVAVNKSGANENDDKKDAGNKDGKEPNE